MARLVRRGAPMHPMLFSVKRTHLVGLAATRPIAGRVGLTPARFDMMRIVALYGLDGLPQWKLMHMLGVSGGVVSRMLRQLEEIGFVYREPSALDRRRRNVFLTDDGAARIHALLVQQRVDDELQRVVLRAFGERSSEGRFARPGGVPTLEVSYRVLTRARVALGDTTPFLHPWRLADLIDEDCRFIRLTETDQDSSIPWQDVLIRDPSVFDSMFDSQKVRPSRPSPDVASHVGAVEWLARLLNSASQ